MHPLLHKLQYRAQSPVCVLQTPDTVRGLLAAFPPEAALSTSPDAIPVCAFMLAFVRQQSEIDTLAPRMAAQLDGDGMLWLAYPKGSSKRYACGFNRDTGWETLGRLGFEPVRQVAIDEDWSALRFRRVEFIKTLTRSTSMALSETGKARTRKAGD
ncbi:MAG: hypothetical protein NW241_00935 [Bacteroidia bacterium]|nr:hypothetical protein [Bacteroidia bacterium]